MFASMFGNKYEEAAELLEKACNNYKLAKMWAEAASGFELLADCHLKSDARHDAASATDSCCTASRKLAIEREFSKEGMHSRFCTRWRRPCS